MEISAVAAHPGFGAEISGVNLREASVAVAGEIAALLDRFAVLVFRNQSLFDEDQVRFARLLGGPLHYGQGAKVVEAQRYEDPALSSISNLDDGGALLSRADPKRMYALANRLWHTDASFQNPPGRYSMLAAKIVPAEGGETDYADMRAAYDDLPQTMKDRLNGLRAHHSVSHSRATIGFYFTAEQQAAYPGADHPLVRELPSGRTSLYIGAHASHVLDAPVPEGRVLLYELTWHATQSRFVYTHRWRPGDLVIWDNRATMHRGRPYDELGEMRDMQRVTTLDLDAVPAAAERGA